MGSAKRPLSPAEARLESSSRSQRARGHPGTISKGARSPEKNTEEQVTTATAFAPWRLNGMPGSEIFYLPNFVDRDVSMSWYKQLEQLDTWYHPTLKVYGKEVSQSRSIAAYAASERITVKYSGHQVNLHYTYPDLVTEIQAMVEEKLGIRFNHVMLNRYADGKEYIGKHRDTKENKIIASLSLGSERTFIFTPNKTCPGAPRSHSFVLHNGSLLIMQGDTQKHWKHEIPKEPKVAGGRISLTFRQLARG